MSKEKETQTVKVPVEVKEEQTIKVPAEEPKDVEKLIQSERSKAKFEILKEIGYENVREIKELTEKGALYKELETKHQELKTKHQELEKEKLAFENERKTYESSLNLVSVGFNPERLHLIKNELTGNAEEDVTNIKEKYPEMFQKVVKKGPFPGDNEDTKKTEAELYIERRKKQAERKI